MGKRTHDNQETRTPAHLNQAALPYYAKLPYKKQKYTLLNRSWSLTKFHHIHIRLERTVNATLLACRYIGDLLICIFGAGSRTRTGTGLLPADFTYPYYFHSSHKLCDLWSGTSYNHIISDLGNSSMFSTHLETYVSLSS